MMIYINHQVMLLQDTDSINASRFSSTVAQEHHVQVGTLCFWYIDIEILFRTRSPYAHTECIYCE